MWSRRKGESNFQRRFPDNVNTGFVSVADSIAVVLLNSNFKKLSVPEIDKQERWYISTLDSLNRDTSIKAIIVSCHHAPYTNIAGVGLNSDLVKGAGGVYADSMGVSSVR
jgi:hypothetical protein